MTMQKYSDRIIIRRCPLIGRLHFVWDFQGFVQMNIIVLYWAYNITMTSNIVLIPNYHEGKISLVFILSKFYYHDVSSLHLLLFMIVIVSE
jgi:hypothetical protein